MIGSIWEPNSLAKGIARASGSIWEPIGLAKGIARAVGDIWEPIGLAKLVLGCPLKQGSSTALVQNTEAVSATPIN